MWMIRVGEDEVERKLPDGYLVRKMLGYATPYKKQMALAAVLTVVGAILGIADPYVLGLAIDRYIANKDSQGLLLVATFYVGILLAEWVTGSIRSYVTSWLGDRVVTDLRKKMFENLQRLPLSYFRRRQVGWLMSRLMSDANTVNMVITSGLLTSMNDLLVVFATISVMMVLNPWLTMLALSVVPLVVLATWKFSMSAKASFRNRSKKLASVSSEIEQSITGVRVIQAFGKEQQAQKSFEKASEEYVDASLSAARVTSGFRPIVDILQTIDMGLLLYFGAYWVISGSLTIGTLVVFMAYVSRFFFPVREITMLYNSLQEALAASERILEVIETEPEVQDPPDAVDAPHDIDRISFEHVGFEYEKGTRVLHDINFDVKAGEFVAIVGPTGAGKTTLASLLVRFHVPTEGKILINDLDIRQVKENSLRRRIMMVPQEPFLFSGSVLDNIRYLRDDASEQEVIEAARSLGIDARITGMERGYHTEVIEGGVGLSTGEKQLISIARAFLANPSVIVLDEAMSSVDPNSEHLVRSAMRRLMKGRTVIMIAHRLSTVVDADRIIVLQGGKIVQEGTHEQLIKQGGLYKQLYEMMVTAEQAAFHPLDQSQAE
jgi:ABC-type multidrug transport system fused ATPase/permease subunit